MKDFFITIIVVAILGFSIYNAWKDNNEMHSHYDFFRSMAEFKEQTKEFMEVGGRNTSTMGRELCDRINILEFHLKEDEALTDCDEIYQ